MNTFQWYASTYCHPQFIRMHKNEQCKTPPSRSFQWDVLFWIGVSCLPPISYQFYRAEINFSNAIFVNDFFEQEQMKEIVSNKVRRPLSWTLWGIWLLFEDGENRWSLVCASTSRLKRVLGYPGICSSAIHRQANSESKIIDRSANFQIFQ